MIDQKRLVLDELRRAFTSAYAAGDILDGKLQNIWSFSSVIATSISFITTIASKNVVNVWYWLFLMLAFVAYCYMFFRVRRRLNPVGYALPISIDMKTLEERYFNVDNERAYDQAILDYTHYIQEVLNNNKLKGDEVEFSAVLMFLIVIFLGIASILGIAFPSS